MVLNSSDGGNWRGRKAAFKQEYASLSPHRDKEDHQLNGLDQ